MNALPANAVACNVRVNRKTVFTALVILIAGFILFRVTRSGFDWPTFFAAFRGVDWRWLLASVLLVYVSHLGRALRWSVMLRPIRPDAHLGGILSATFAGFAAIVLLGRAGEVVRPYMIANHEKVTFSSQMAIWLLERVLDVLMILLIFGYALVTVPADRLHLGTSLQWVFRTGGFLCAGLGAACLIFIFALRNFGDRAPERISAALSFLPARFSEKVGRWAAGFADGARAVSNSRYLIWMLIYSALTWSILIAAYFCLFHSVEATSSFSLDQVAVFMGLVAFGTAVQIPGIGGGFQIAAILVFREIFGFRLETATGTAVLLWAASFLPVVPPGLLLGFRDGLNWRKIRMIQDSTATESVS